MASLQQNPNDTVTIAPGVLLTIVRMASLSVEGVVRTANIPGGVDRWFRRNAADDGVHIETDEGSVKVDVYLIVNTTRSLHTTCREVQSEIARTIKEYAGMKVSAVNVHIEDVVFSKS